MTEAEHKQAERVRTVTRYVCQSCGESSEWPGFMCECGTEQPSPRKVRPAAFVELAPVVEALREAENLPSPFPDGAAGKMTGAQWTEARQAYLDRVRSLLESLSRTSE